MRPCAAALSASAAVTKQPPYSGDMSILATALTVAGGLVAPPAVPPAAPAARAAAQDEVVIGRSAQGRPIRAVRIGSPRARVKVLVVGTVHGNEPAGRAVVDRLRRGRPPRGTALWL